MVQFLDNIVKVSHAVTIYGIWIFDANYEITLHLVKKKLNMIYALPYNDRTVSKVKKVYKSVRYINPKENKVDLK